MLIQSYTDQRPLSNQVTGLTQGQSQRAVANGRSGIRCPLEQQNRPTTKPDPYGSIEEQFAKTFDDCMASVKDTTPQKPKILEALGCRVAALTRVLVKKARELPVLGKTIGLIEDTASPWLEPVIAHVAKDGLYLLSVVDDKIHTVSDIAMAHVPFAAKFIPYVQTILSGQPIDTALMVLDRVRTRGVVGSTADIWVDYEPIVKSESQKIYSLVVRVPGAQLMVSVLQDIGSPLVAIASDWLVMHTEFKDKHGISLQTQASLSSPDSPVTPCKVPGHSDPKAFDFNALADENESASSRSSDLSHSEPLESTEAAQSCKEEIATDPVKDGESAFTDKKGKSPELVVVHQDENEQDELSDLFDTWGMGVQAIGPNRLKSLRSLSLK